MMRKLQGTEFYSTNLAADICLPKMEAGLLSNPKRQFYPSKNNRIHFPFITKIPDDTLVTKTPAELPSTEQIFTETTRLVPLCSRFQAKIVLCVFQFQTLCCREVAIMERI